MSQILGVDLDSRAVHVVLVDGDTSQARYVHIEIRAKHESAFDAARNVRVSMFETLRRVGSYDDRGTRAHGIGAFWDDVLLVGIEDSMYRSPQTVRALARVQGAILAAVPRDVCVIPIPAGEWKALTVGRANASKDDVHEWGILTLQAAGAWSEDHRAWPQDAWDALAIARAARALNERGIAAA